MAHSTRGNTSRRGLPPQYANENPQHWMNRCYEYLFGIASTHVRPRAALQTRRSSTRARSR